MPSAEKHWQKELANANAVVTMADALVTDGDWTGIDPTKLPAGFIEYYSGLTSAGYANGWI